MYLPQSPLYPTKCKNMIDYTCLVESRRTKVALSENSSSWPTAGEGVLWVHAGQQSWSGLDPLAWRIDTVFVTWRLYCLITQFLVVRSQSRMYIHCGPYTVCIKSSRHASVNRTHIHSAAKRCCFVLYYFVRTEMQQSTSAVLLSTRFGCLPFYICTYVWRHSVTMTGT